MMQIMTLVGSAAFSTRTYFFELFWLENKSAKENILSHRAERGMIRLKRDFTRFFWEGQQSDLTSQAHTLHHASE